MSRPNQSNEIQKALSPTVGGSAFFIFDAFQLPEKENCSFLIKKTAHIHQMNPRQAIPSVPQQRGNLTHSPRRKECLMASQVKKYILLSDAACKHIIGDKLRLGGILKECVPEFKNCSVTDIENKYIEGEPEISAVGVHPDMTNVNQSLINTGQIHGINTESVTETEGRITYDIRFYAMTPGNTPVKIIVNMEAQNEFYPGYPHLKRAIYYAARQISSQYGSEFDHAHYEKIKKVYSIWICFDPPAYKQNTITTYQMTEKLLLGSAHDKRENYDLMTVVMICLGKSKKCAIRESSRC